MHNTSRLARYTVAQPLVGISGSLLIRSGGLITERKEPISGGISGRYSVTEGKHRVAPVQTDSLSIAIIFQLPLPSTALAGYSTPKKREEKKNRRHSKKWANGDAKESIESEFAKRSRFSNAASTASLAHLRGTVRGEWYKTDIWD